MQINLDRINDFINAIEATGARSAHIEAYEQLQSGNIDAALNIWDDYARKNPSDYTVIHHQAIIHHSIAYEKEQTGDGRDALPHWKKALSYWHRLWTNKEFWDIKIRKMIDYGTDQKGFAFYQDRFKALKRRLKPELQDEDRARELWEKAIDKWISRREIPEWWKEFEQVGIKLGGDFDVCACAKFVDEIPEKLLDVHYSLITHYNAVNDLDLAHEHMQLILQSGFDTKIQEEIRKNLTRLLLPSRETAQDEQDIDDIFNKIKRLLTIDPENIEGLEFLLFIYNERNTYLAAKDDLDAIERNISEIKNIGLVEKLKASVNQATNFVLKTSINYEIKKVNQAILSVLRKRINNIGNKFKRGQGGLTDRDNLKGLMKKFLKYADSNDDKDEIDFANNILNQL